MNVLEIGSFEGRSSVWILQNVVGHHPASTLTCIDPFPSPELDSDAGLLKLKSWENPLGGRGPFIPPKTIPGLWSESPAEKTYGCLPRYVNNICQSSLAARATLEKGDSKFVLRSYMDEMQVAMRKFDLIYVDGDHTFMPTFLDLMLTWRLLNLNGMLIVDDYTFEPVQRAFALFSTPAHYGGTFKVLRNDLQLALIKTGDKDDTFAFLDCAEGEVVATKNAVECRPGK